MNKFLLNSLAFFPVICATVLAAAPPGTEIFDTRAHRDYNIHVIFSPAEELQDGAIRFTSPDQDHSLLLSIKKNGGWHLDYADKNQQKALGAGQLDSRKDLLIKCRGTSLSLYNGFKLLMSITLPAPLSGSWIMDNALMVMAPESYGQPVGSIRFDDDFAREADVVGAWESETDAFSVVAAPQPGAAMNAFWYHGSSPARAVTRAGYDMWDGYRFRVAIKRLGSRGDCGIVVGASEFHQGWAVISRGPKLILVSLESPDVILAEADCPLRPDQWYMAEIQYSDTHLRCLVDNSLIIDQQLSSRGGRIGLLVSGATALFDDVSVRSLAAENQQPEDLATIPDFFKKDPYMRTWTGELPELKGYKIRNFFFQKQPVDWIPLQGDWESFSRWPCKPKWPFFGAHPQPGAMVCYKRPLRGDFTIDLFASSPMYDRRSPGYNYPLNLQIMVHTPDGQPGTGYRFVYGSHDIPSMIEADGVCLTSSDDLVKTNLRHGFGGPRSMNQLVHRRWPKITVSRRKGLLSMQVNNSPLLSVADPTPSAGGLLSIGAWRNGISIARIRVAAEAFGDTLHPASPIYTSQPTAEPLKKGLDLSSLEEITDIAEPPLALGSVADDGFSWHSGFAKGIPPWFTIRGSEGATPRLKKEDADHFVRLVNTRFGGAMAVCLWRGSLPLSAKPYLRFNYRIPVWMKCNIRCQLDNGRWLEIPFLDKNQATFRTAGGVKGIHSTTEWQEVEVDLQSLLRGQQGNLRQIILADSDHCSSYTGSFYDLKSVQVSSQAKMTITDPRQHKKAPPFDTGSYGSVLSLEDCEGDIPSIISRDGASFMPVERRSGGHSLWLFHNERYAGRSSVCIFNQPYKPSQYPHLSFDYRGERPSILLQAIVGQQEVPLMRLSLKTDTQWHRATIDINRLLTKHLPDAEAPVVENLLFTISYGSNHLEVDNIVISDGAGTDDR